jgi:hypothetical protein
VTDAVWFKIIDLTWWACDVMPAPAATCSHLNLIMVHVTRTRTYDTGWLAIVLGWSDFADKFAGSVSSSSVQPVVPRQVDMHHACPPSSAARNENTLLSYPASGHPLLPVNNSSFKSWSGRHKVAKLVGWKSKIIDLTWYACSDATATCNHLIWFHITRSRSDQLIILRGLVFSFFAPLWASEAASIVTVGQLRIKQSKARSQTRNLPVYASGPAFLL